MKKNILLILCCIFFFPMCVYAEDTTEKLYIDINVQEDGSIKVRELASLAGDYNGRLRSIDYKNPNTKAFTGKDEDFGGSDIYNGSSIENVKVYDVLDKDTITFDSMNRLNTEFIQVSNANTGDYGVYYLQNTSTGIELKIFNPSSRNSAFYIEYEINDVVVVHQDVAELAFNILGNNYEENIEDLEVRIILPDSDPTMLVWGHGPLNGTIKRTTDQMATLTYDFLGARNAIDVRMMFNKTLVTNAKKNTNVIAKDKILAYEKIKADEANQERERIKLVNNLIKGGTVGWCILLLGAALYMYIKYDKEHKINFNMKYYRDFPAEYGPEILEYLLKKNISSNGFSAAILEIVRKKALKVEEVEDKKSEYRFVKVEEYMPYLNEKEQKIVSLLIDEIGDGKQVTLKQIKKYGKNTSKAKKFMDSYYDWLGDAKFESEQEEFYHKQTAPIVVGLLIVFLSFIVFSINLELETEFILGYLSLPIGIVVGIYCMFIKKRTTKGALQYQEWMAFKRFLLDFGRMDEKTLPELSLWEKYLVYATVLGCAKQLEKEMKIKLENININDQRYMNMTDFYIINSLTRSNIASVVSNTVNNAVSSSRASIASSQSSSGSGFGGGMSSGGGSFGGGGGGGRF